ncbi:MULTISPECIES: four helix bundle protein [Gracilimonas]|uniref:Four helix bundle protein n=1 Tax=Gracilimonas sediminicola TaxID=2952158 RepID=A0A9X2L1D0_9BACT|nr:four helix bundle protein [Gracilimonas sediminicola]MCP9290521.1 four helix bundle protein [Gracilimonas sediminicola]
MINLNHKQLNVYKKSVELVSEIYRLTENYPKAETFGLTSQMRRAAVSIPSNLSEGASRKSEKDRKRFYRISRSSLVELDTQLEISINLNYLNNNNTKKVEKLANEVFAMLSNMI